MTTLPTYPPYPAYKPSGLDWLGAIPAHWEMKRLKHIAEVVLGKMLQNGKQGDDELKPYLRSLNVQWEKVNVSDVKEMWFSKREIEKYRLKKYDLVVSEGGEVGRTAIWNDEIPECYIQNSVHKITPGQKINPFYLLYQFVTFGKCGFFDAIVNQVSIGHLTREKLVNLEFFLPPLAEQAAIADFLDRKTAQIDTFLALKAKAVALLKERKTAIINAAVTRGLNPAAPMKSSGIEWLGDIPAHWNVKKLRHVCKVTDCKHLTPEYIPEGIPVVSTGNVKSYLITLDSVRMVSKQDFVKLIEGGRLPEKGDIIYSRNASVGAAAVVRSEEPFCLGQDVCLVRSKENQDYLELLLNSPFILDQLEQRLLGSTFRRINIEQINEFILLIPPLDEQRQIVASIEQQAVRIDTAIAQAEREAALMQEYRQALISAAVTGKMKIMKN